MLHWIGPVATLNTEMEGYPVWSGCDPSLPSQLRQHVVTATNGPF